jgi:hypothetical protein
MIIHIAAKSNIRIIQSRQLVSSNAYVGRGLDLGAVGGVEGRTMNEKGNFVCPDSSQTTKLLAVGN